MGYMAELIFWVVIAVVAGFFGSSRREEKKVDANKTVMRQNPSLRYSMYLVGILICGMIIFLGTASIRDGAQERDPWILLLIIVGLLLGALCFVAGYIFYARHVFFDEEELLIGRPFKKMLHVKWQEISRMEIKKNRLLLYGAEGKRLIAADFSLENYDLFSDMAKRMCSAKLPKKESTWKNGQCVMTRRMAGTAMLALVLVFLVFFSIIINGLSVNEKSLFFLILLVAGLAGLFYAVVLHMEKIRYTKEEITFCSLFGNKSFSWRNLQRIRKEQQGSTSVQKLYLTWEGKEHVVSSKKYAAQYNEFLDFVIDIALERNIPSQNL